MEITSMKQCGGVLQATHKQTGKIMALKRNKHTNSKMNILREVQLMNRLCHPNILRYLVCSFISDLLFVYEVLFSFSLEYCISNWDDKCCGIAKHWSVSGDFNIMFIKGCERWHTIWVRIEHAFITKLDSEFLSMSKIRQLCTSTFMHYTSGPYSFRASMPLDKCSSIWIPLFNKV